MLQPIIEGETAHFFEEIKVFCILKANSGSDAPSGIGRLGTG